ncbi:MAG: hypothetical protein ACE5IT_09125 [bacterium]
MAEIKSCADCGMKVDCGKMPCYVYDATTESERSCGTCINRYACFAICPHR